MSQEMRDRMESFALIPFSFGCNSDSSVAVCTTQLPEKKYKDSSFAVLREKEESERKPCREKSVKTKKRALLGFPKPLFFNGLHRLKKSLNCFSHLSVDNKEDEVEEMEMEMEIGFPTDVKHVSHIGLDGSTTINPIPEWKNLKAPHEILSFPSISLKQFELAMAAQSNAHLTTASSGDSKFNSISNFN